MYIYDLDRISAVKKKQLIEQQVFHLFPIVFTLFLLGVCVAVFVLEDVGKTLCLLCWLEAIKLSIARVVIGFVVKRKGC